MRNKSFKNVKFIDNPNVGIEFSLTKRGEKSLRKRAEETNQKYSKEFVEKTVFNVLIDLLECDKQKK